MMIKIIFDKNKSIAYDGDKKIGECDFEETEEGWNIVHTEVDTSYQGQGIARKLVEIILEKAEEQGANTGDFYYIYAQLEKLQGEEDEYKEYQESNGTRGLSYNDIAEKYDIKREYINKNNIKNIKTLLFNREQARKTTTYDDDYDLSDLPDFMNTFDEFDIQLYNKQKKIREEQEEESKKKIA